MKSHTILRPAPTPGARNKYLTAIRRDGYSRSDVAAWLVQCGMCGREIHLTTNQWRCNKSGMCNECRRRTGMIGKRFGKLTVVKWAGVDDKHANQLWECKCDCGGTITAPTTLLNRGKMKSCGCMRARHDLEGKRFGKITVIRRIGLNRFNAVLWECRCDCGRVIVERASKLNSKPGQGIRSCGCDGRKNIPRDDQQLYDKWAAMRKHPHWRKWDDYATFKRWAERNGYHNGFTLVREDRNLPHSPSNSYWLNNPLLGKQYSSPSNWKPMTVYRDGDLFGQYPSLSAAAADVWEEEPNRTLEAILTALRDRASHKRTVPYLGHWMAEYDQNNARSPEDWTQAS